MKATFEPLTRAEIHAHAVSNHEEENPAIYLGTYRKYNSGDLFGMWIDLTTFANYKEFCDFCTRVHSVLPANLSAKGRANSSV